MIKRLYKTYLNASTLRVIFPEIGHICVEYQIFVRALFFGVSGIENVDIMSKLEVLNSKPIF